VSAALSKGAPHTAPTRQPTCTLSATLRRAQPGRGPTRKATPATSRFRGYVAGHAVVAFYHVGVWCSREFSGHPPSAKSAEQQGFFGFAARVAVSGRLRYLGSRRAVGLMVAIVCRLRQVSGSRVRGGQWVAVFASSSCMTEGDEKAVRSRKTTNYPICASVILSAAKNLP